MGANEAVNLNPPSSAKIPLTPEVALLPLSEEVCPLLPKELVMTSPETLTCRGHRSSSRPMFTLLSVPRVTAGQQDRVQEDELVYEE